MKNFLTTITLTIILLCVEISMTSCDKNIIDTNVTEICVHNIKTGKELVISNKDSINTIVFDINSCRQEFCIFMPSHEMVCKYKNQESKTILIKGNVLKIDGVPYKRTTDDAIIDLP